MADRLTTDKSPQVAIERAEFFLRFHELYGVCDRRLDLETVAYDSRVMEEPLDLLVLVTRNLRGVESIECIAVVFPLVENDVPVALCLCTLQDETSEQGLVI